MTTEGRNNTLDLNPVGASDIAKDKDYANLFMRRLGYPIVPDSKTFFSKEWAQAIIYMSSYGMITLINYNAICFTIIDEKYGPASFKMLFTAVEQDVFVFAPTLYLLILTIGEI